MIGYLRGQILQHDLETLVVDVNGVGYEVFCSQATLSQVSGRETVELYIYTAVREDAITLYGFYSKLEKELFLTLIKVNGVGPKLAVNILSGAPVETILQMIEAEDVKALCQLPKVGKKTAEQLILSLKGKLPEISFSPTERGQLKGNRADITSALVHLGFRLQDVERVVAEMSHDTDVEAGIRKGLSTLSQI